MITKQKRSQKNLCH